MYPLFIVQTNASSKRKSAFERLGDEETMSKDMNSFSHKIKVAKLGTSTKSPPSKIVSLTKVSFFMITVMLW